MDYNEMTRIIVMWGGGVCNGLLLKILYTMHAVLLTDNSKYERKDD